MKNKIPAVLAFCILFFLAVGWIAYFLKQPLSFKHLSQEQNLEKFSETKIENKNEAWVEKISNQQTKSFSYPTNEMVLQYNFNRGVEPLRIFIEDLNEYRFYCINQILIENKIEYAYYKTDKVIQLVVFLNNKEMQHRILEDFNYYKIKYSIHNT